MTQHLSYMFVVHALSGKIWKSLVYRFQQFSNLHLLWEMSANTVRRTGFFRYTPEPRVAEEDWFRTFASSIEAFRFDRTYDECTLAGKGRAAG